MHENAALGSERCGRRPCQFAALACQSRGTHDSLRLLVIFGHCLLLRSRSCAFQGAPPETTPLSHSRIVFITRGIARDEVLALWQAVRAAA
jgi:hypothetical protein